MKKVKISVATVGYINTNFDRQKILKWKSKLFEVNKEILSYEVLNNSDGVSWEYSDLNMAANLPTDFESDLLICIVNVPLKDNFYTRRLNKNRVVFTFHEIQTILEYSNIPLENVVYRLLYSYALIYKGLKGIPPNSEFANFTHDDTRGCLYDMNGIKTDIIHSCNKPIICPMCVERLKITKFRMKLLTMYKGS
ncbi:MAG: hypothetical protein COC24_007950 [Alphaproteobacteria bacterium]|nr:hypothetical protein [Alphaproteobacteria bacterium]